MDISKNIYFLHKRSLPNDPLHFFRIQKGVTFFRSLINLRWIKTIKKENKIISFAAVLPVLKINKFIYLVFLATFCKSLKKLKSNTEKKFFKRGILVYICVEKEFRGNQFGSKILKSFKKDGFEEIYFITKKKTYNKFYKKNFQAYKIELFGKCFCKVIL